jgi:hypothetical protein
LQSFLTLTDEGTAKLVLYLAIGAAAQGSTVILSFVCADIIPYSFTAIGVQGAHAERHVNNVASDRIVGSATIAGAKAAVG